MLLWPVTRIASVFGGPALAVTFVRIFAALVGATNIWLIGRIGRRWMGEAGGIVAALVYATAPVVTQTEASVLQEPFVNLFVLLAVVVWADRPDAQRTTRRLVAAGLLVGAAVPIKLIAGMFLVPLLIAVPFARPVADRVRLTIAASLPLAVTGAVIALAVGWHPIFEQAFMAQVLRPQDGEGLSRVDSMLPMLRGQVELTTFLSSASAWIAVLVFVAAGAGAMWKGGRPGRLGGTTGLVVLGVLMASSPYFAHYAVLIAPTVALITGWALTRAYAWVQDRHVVAPAIVSGGAILVVAIGIAQVSTTVDELPVGVAQMGSRLDTIVHDGGRPTAGAVSKSILRAHGYMHRRHASAATPRREPRSVRRPERPRAPRRLRQRARRRAPRTSAIVQAARRRDPIHPTRDPATGPRLRVHRLLPTPLPRRPQRHHRDNPEEADRRDPTMGRQRLHRDAAPNDLPITHTSCYS